ncbi:MAG: DNA polymerase III subunit alpha [bacterium]|nr:DNA polymerase III subunit alpha [bacterium]
MSTKFCHLHLHTEYSLLDGVIRIADLVKAVKMKGMDAVAITDHGVMYGAIEFLDACNKEKIKPIIGCEVYIAPGKRQDKSAEGKGGNSHLVLLAMDQTGYRNLATLVSLAYKEGFYYKPRLDSDLIAKYSDGLIALSACLKGEINQWLLSNRKEKAVEVAEIYKGIFGPDRFFIEIQDHGIDEQKRVLPLLVDLAKTTGLKVVATNDCHFLEPDDHYVQDVMICVQTGKKLQDRDRMHAYTRHHYLKSTEEMLERFNWIPEAIENAGKIAEMVDFNPALGKSFHFPEFTISDKSSPEGFLKNRARDELKIRMNNDVPDEYRERLDFELNVICDMGFASYLLIVADFVKWARDNDVLVGPGRGSAAGCLVSYALGIIDIDPVLYGLQFERFLNPARKSMPDIDIDFDPVGRADVIDYVTKLYGDDHVCQIITFNRLKARAALRDVGRVMDIPLGDVDRIAKLVPFGEDLDFAIKKSPDFKREYEKSELAKTWIDTAKRVEGFARNASVHAAGVIICKDPIWDHAPVQTMEKASGAVCQFSMDDAAKVGLVKMDFLGLRTLSYLNATCENVKKSRGIAIDLLKIPLDDKKTYKMLSKGDTLGIFQMEGGGMRDLLMQISPDKIEDLIATLALFRPGPMKNNLHTSYAKRKNKKEAIKFKHDLLKPILGETYGVLTYQEQISLILQALGGLDLGIATIVMKLISKKKEPAEIAKYMAEFLSGAEQRGVNRIIASEIWKEMEAFAEYGFNKAHSASYALVAYQTAYMKANFPLEFYSAYMTSEMHNQDKIGLICDEMKRKKIMVYPPDINKSFSDFTVEGKGIRYGLAALKGVGHQAVESIVKAREEKGKFENIFQVVSNADIRLLNKGVLESLICAGAFDGLQGNRKSNLEKIADALDYAKKLQDDESRGQVGLFGGAAAMSSGPSMEVTGEYLPVELLRLEKESLGFYLSKHPLDSVWEKIKGYTRQNINDLVELNDGNSVRVGGMFGWVSKKITKTSMKYYAKFGLEDLTGKIDGIIFPKSYEKYGGLVESEAFVLIKGKLKIEELESTEDEEQVRKQVELIAEEIWRYNPESEHWIQQRSPTEMAEVDVPLVDMIIEDDSIPPLEHVETETTGMPFVDIILDLETADKSGMKSLKKLLLSRKGQIPVRFRFPLQGRDVIIKTGPEHEIVFSEELKEELVAIPGIQDVRLDSGSRA